MVALLRNIMLSQIEWFNNYEIVTFDLRTEKFYSYNPKVPTANDLSRVSTNVIFLFDSVALK